MDLTEITSETGVESESVAALQAWFKKWPASILAAIRNGHADIQSISRESKRSVLYIHRSLEIPIEQGFVDKIPNESVGVGQPKILFKWTAIAEETLKLVIEKTYQNGAIKQAFGFAPTPRRTAVIPKEEVDFFCREYPEIVRRILFSSSRQDLNKIIDMQGYIIPDACEIMGADRSKLRRLVAKLAPCVRLSRNKIIIPAKFRAIKSITLMSTSK